MAESFLINIRGSKRPASQTSEVKPILEICAQMFGSGKSYLGFYFLSALKSPEYKEIRNSLEKIYPEEWEILLSCVYLVLDLRDIVFEQNEVTKLKIFLVRSMMNLLRNEIQMVEHLKQFKEWVENKKSCSHSLFRINPRF